jgi:hypothetical protein
MGVGQAQANIGTKVILVALRPLPPLPLQLALQTKSCRSPLFHYQMLSFRLEIVRLNLQAAIGCFPASELMWG